MEAELIKVPGLIEISPSSPFFRGANTWDIIAQEIRVFVKRYDVKHWVIERIDFPVIAYGQTDIVVVRLSIWALPDNNNFNNSYTNYTV